MFHKYQTKHGLTTIGFCFVSIDFIEKGANTGSFYSKPFD